MKKRCQKKRCQPPNLEKLKDCPCVDCPYLVPGTFFLGVGHSGGAMLGRANTGGAFVNGVIDEYRLDGRLLTAEEIATLFRAVSAEKRGK